MILLKLVFWVLTLAYFRRQGSRKKKLRVLRHPAIGEFYSTFTSSRFNGKKTYQRLIIPFEQPNRFVFREETRWIKILLFFGIVREMQIGNQMIDDRYFVGAEHNHIIRFFQENKNLAQHLLNLPFKVTRIECRGKGELILESEILEYRESDLNQIADLIEVLRQLPKMRPHSLHFGLIVFELFCFSFFYYAIISIGLFLYFTAFDVFSWLEIFGLGIVFGSFCFFGLVCLHLLFLRKFHFAGLALADSGLILFFSFVLSGPGALMDINRVFANQPAEITKAMVESKQVSPARTFSRRGRQYRFELQLRYIQNPENLPSRLDVNILDYMKFSEGDGIEIFIKTGRLGIPFISERKSVLLTHEELSELEQQKSKYDENKKAKIDPRKLHVFDEVELQTIKKAIAWVPEQIDLTSVSSTNSYYVNGQLKSRLSRSHQGLHGIGLYFYPNGQIYAQIPYVHGQRHGSYFVYRANGKKELKASFKHEKAHGFFQWYDENEKIIHQAVYVEGHRVMIENDRLLELIHESRRENEKHDN